MHYVYLTNNVVTDQSQIDPFLVFSPEYAKDFIESPDEVTFYWTYNNGTWEPPYVPPIDWVSFNKSKAQQLLQETDWVTLSDVRDTSVTPHLVNFADFDTYRLELRVIAINPPDTEITDWPIKPTEEWSS